VAIWKGVPVIWIRQFGILMPLSGGRTLEPLSGWDLWGMMVGVLNVARYVHGE